MFFIVINLLILSSHHTFDHSLCVLTVVEGYRVLKDINPQVLLSSRAKAFLWQWQSVAMYYEGALRVPRLC